MTILERKLNCKIMKKIETSDAPAAIGPYSQAILAGGFLFLSGQLPLNPKTGQLIQGSIKEMTFQIFDNIEAILRTESLTLYDVVRMEIFLNDLSDFKEMNIAYAERMKGHKPARHTFQVAALPLAACIEITCTAYKG